jgi:ubiquinone/menaquinone biosynthesis C-methylase UbiE
MRLGLKDVLETAAGTGVLTRAIASVLPGSARLVVTDLNKAMLDVAQSTLSRDARIEWSAGAALWGRPHRRQIQETIFAATC